MPNAQRYLNAAGVQAIKDAIGNVSDNLYRYEMAERAHPGQQTGNGEPYVEVIASLKRKLADLEANLQEA